MQDQGHGLGAEGVTSPVPGITLSLLKFPVRGHTARDTLYQNQEEQAGCYGQGSGTNSPRHWPYLKGLFSFLKVHFKFLTLIRFCVWFLKELF